MRRAWEGLSRIVTSRAAVILVVIAVITLVLAGGATRLKFATGQDSYLNPGDKVSVDNRAYQSLFGGQAMITVMTADPGKDVLALFTAANRAKMVKLQAQLDHTEGVHSAATPLTAMNWNSALVAPAKGSKDPTSSVAGKILLSTTNRETSAARKKIRLDDANATLKRFSEAGVHSYDNPKWVRFLLFDNQGNIREALRPFFPTPPGVAPTAAHATHARIIVRLNGNQTTQQEGKASVAVTDAVRAVHFDGFTTFTTGAPTLLKHINDYLMGGMLVLGAIAVVVMVVVLALVFRVRSRLLPLLVMVVGVIWTFGILGYTGFRLSVVTIAGLPILIGLGVEFAIQVHNRVEEEIAHGGDRSPFEATLVHIGPALLVATIAAMLACIALKASLTPMIRDFGLLLAIGIGFGFLAALVIPAAVLSIRERRSPTTHEPHQRIVEATMTKLGHLPQVLVIPLVVAAVGLFVIGLFAEQRTPIQTDPNKWVDQSSGVIKDINNMQAQTGASSELGVYLRDRRGVFNDQMAAFSTAFAIRELNRYPGKLSTVSSLSTTVFYLTDVPGATKLPPTGADIHNAYNVAPVDLQRSMVAANDTAMNVLFETGPSTLEVRKEVTENIRATVRPPTPITATPSGLAVIGVGLLDNLTANRLLLVTLALSLVFVWLLLRFRNLVKAVLLMLPIMLAVGLSATIVKLSGITVSPLTTVGSPLVIAICGEFSSLIMFRHLEERRHGLAPQEAMDVAATHTGRAFFASSLTTVGGFAVLLFSPLPLLRDFGAIVAITIAIALLSAMCALPPMLVWAENHGLLHIGPPSSEGVPPEPSPNGQQPPYTSTAAITSSETSKLA